MILSTFSAGRFMRVLASSLMLNATFPLDVLAQTTPAAVAQPATGQPFNTEQLDALVASIALYPDDLLTQLLMASTFPLEVVAAARWVEDPAHKSLSGDALVKALEAESWDPSVKSLVPFPVVLATLNGNLTWLQQLGYAFATQQADVFAAVQRLRRLAQANDKLQSSPQQVVSTQQVTVEPPAGSSQPADAAGGDRHRAGAVGHRLRAELRSGDGVRLVVAGYPSYPPYYPAQPPGYYFGTALATGLAFAAGAAVVGGLWGWASPGWGGGYANVNVNRYNNINANRRRSIRTVGAPALGAGGPAISPARPADRRGFPAVRRSPYPAMRCGLRHARGVGAWAVSAGLVGRVASAALAVPAALVGRRCGRCRRRWSAGWRRRRGRCRRRWSAGRRRGVGGVGGAGRPGGAGGVGGVGGAGRPGGAGGVGGVGSAGRPAAPAVSAGALGGRAAWAAPGVPARSARAAHLVI